MNNAELVKLVQCYCDRYKPRFVAKIMGFGTKRPFKAAVKIAAKGEEVDRTKNRHLHWLWSRSKKRALSKAVKILTGMTTELECCCDFQTLHELITKNVSRIKGVKKVYCYDVAMRIGACKGFLPKKVYVHANKVRKATVALNLEIDGDETVDLRNLPRPLRCLKAYEIEDFFCVFADALSRVERQ